MKKLKYLILVLLVFLFVTSCTMQKRVYRKGYYTHWKSLDSNKKVEEPLSASIDKNLFIAKKKPIKDSVKIVDCGDSLWLKTGMVANVTIIEETETEVKYKLCDNLDGPISIVPKSNVERIKYAYKIVDCNDSLWLRNSGVVRIKVLSDKEPYIKYKRCDDVKGRTYKILMEDVDRIKYANGEVYEYKKTIYAQSANIKPKSFSEKSVFSLVLGIMSIALFVISGISIATFDIFFFPLILFAVLGIIFGTQAIHSSNKDGDIKSRLFGSLGSIISIVAIISVFVLGLFILDSNWFM